MPAAGSDDAIARPWQRRLMVGIVVLVGLHSAVLAVWLSPANPTRDSISTTTLASYVEPYFQQSWKSLDPRLQRVDESFRIRARIQDARGKKVRATPWVDLTKNDTDSSRNDLDPARVHLVARRIATSLNAAMLALNPAQRKLVNTDYITTSLADLRQRLMVAGANPRAVQAYMSYNQMATEFASMYAKAMWPDDEIVAVQYVAGRRTVPDHSDRDKTTLADIDYLWSEFGYRKAYQASYEAQTTFDSYVKK
jgi:hypothetical protein